MRRIGAWQIRGRLRRGNHGVFCAVSPAGSSAGANWVAKVVDQVDSDRVFEQFANELRLLAMLDGKGAAEVSDVGTHRGRLFYVSPRYSRLPALSRKALQQLVPAARAVGVLHRAGVAHRDLKPDNLLSDGTMGRVCDLGLAEQVDPGRRTWGVGPIGALAYADPAVVRGGCSGPASDVWALGVVAHEIACGVTVYPRVPLDDPLRSMEWIGAAPPEIDPGLPEPLRGIVMKALRCNGMEKYADAADLADDLEGALS